MSLRDIAESDLAMAMEDDVCGFAWPITITDPDGTAVALQGLSNDIAQIIDPETGVAVSGRAASVAVRLSTVEASALNGLPKAIADESIRPWKVTFDDIGGTSWTFKISQSNPDRALGVLTLQLELYG